MLGILQDMKYLYRSEPITLRALRLACHSGYAFGGDHKLDSQPRTRG